jgi:hypothetical protein
MFLTLPCTVQTLSLMKAHVNKRAMVAVKGASVAVLEEGTAKLLADLEQTRLALAEAKASRNSLSMKHGKLEKDCTGLHAAVDKLGQEKAQAMVDHKAALATEHKIFLDYHVHHRKKLHELR